MVKLILVVLLVAVAGLGTLAFLFWRMDTNVKELMQTVILSHDYACSAVVVEGFQPEDEQGVQYFVAHCPEGRYAIGISQADGELGGIAVPCDELAASGQTCDDFLVVRTPSPF